MLATLFYEYLMLGTTAGSDTLSLSHRVLLRLRSPPWCLATASSSEGIVPISFEASYITIDFHLLSTLPCFLLWSYWWLGKDGGGEKGGRG